jgi:hypothetical protein
MTVIRESAYIACGRRIVNCWLKSSEILKVINGNDPVKYVSVNQTPPCMCSDVRALKASSTVSWNTRPERWPVVVNGLILEVGGMFHTRWLRNSSRIMFSSIR